MDLFVLGPEAPRSLYLLRKTLLRIDTPHPANTCLGEVLLKVISLHQLHQLALVVLLVFEVIQTVVVLDAYLNTQILISFIQKHGRPFRPQYPCDAMVPKKHKFMAGHTYSVEINQLLDVLLRSIRPIDLDLIFNYELGEVCRQLARLASPLIDFVLRIIVKLLH